MCRTRRRKPQAHRWLRVAIWDWRRKTRPMARPGRETKSLDVERRGTVRFACNLKVTFRPIALLELTPVPARVRDVSTRGIGLISAIPMAMGTFIVIDLPNAQDSPPLRKAARIVRLVLAEGNRWLLGCAFTRELTTDEVKALV